MEDIAEDSPIKIVPKLTIKMDGSATDSPFYVDKSPRSEQKIPKITLKTGTDHAIIIRHNQLNQLPKITIKTKSVVDSSNSVETTMHGSPNKLMARQINDPVNEERVPKIMISRDKTGVCDVLEKVVESKCSIAPVELETIEILSSSSNCSSDVKIAVSGVEAEPETIEVDDNDEEEENGIDVDVEEEVEQVKVAEETEAIEIVAVESTIQVEPEVDEIPMDMPKVRKRGRPRKQVFEGAEQKKTDDKVRVFPVDEDSSSQKPEEETPATPVIATRKFFVLVRKRLLKESFSSSITTETEILARERKGKRTWSTGDTKYTQDPNGWIKTQSKSRESEKIWRERVDCETSATPGSVRRGNTNGSFGYHRQRHKRR